MEGTCAIRGQRQPKSSDRVFALLLGMGLALSSAACGRFEANKSCNNEANGLKSSGWNGQDLTTKQLSFVFLKGPAAISADIGTFLKFSNISATFFAQGSEVEAHKEALGALREQGHLIGNSGYKGGDLTLAEHPVLEMRETDGLITPYVTGNMFLFYAPFKSFNDQTAALFRTNGLGKYIGPIKDDSAPSPTFRYDAQCWEEGLTPAACASQYFDELKRIDRGIVAFHDTKAETLELLNQLVPQLTAFGFTFVRLDQVPAIRTALTRAGGQVDLTAGPASCDDYE